MSFIESYYRNGLASNITEANARFLQDMAVEGLCKRGITPDSPEWKEYTDRLRHELEVINNGDLADFFLDTSFGCLKMKSRNTLLGMGRGSAAGSLVAFCLKITEIDPIKYDLKFERFLNYTRLNSVSSADIDIDIPGGERQEVLEMYKEDFGRDRSFQVINKLKWTKKTAIDDLGRIIDVPFMMRKRISKLIGDSDDPESIPDVAKYLSEHPFIADNYNDLAGMIKSYSIHAGGLIILDKPVEFHDSILRVNGVDCLDNDGKTCDSLGYLKQDLLGIKTLDIVSDCLDLLCNKIELPTEFDDPLVYETINKSTLGLFQIEGAGADQVCQELRPSSFDELSALLAICRPGSVDSGDKDHYVNRKHGLEPIEYDHPDLEPILKETYGCIVYQEDLMNIVTDFAGMTPVDADNIRRGVGKKLQYVFDEYYPKFIQACVDKGVTRDIAELIWSKMEASASYSFNKSHAVSYAALTYITAYLKTYYPVDFLLAVLNNTNDEDKRVKIYNELESLNKNIKNPDINKSKEITTEDDENIYLSFGLIKGVGPSAIEKIIANQPYENFNDFCDRSGVNKTVKKALAEAGAFDSFGNNRCDLYNIIEGLPKTVTKKMKDGTRQKVHVPAETWSEREILLKEVQRIKINPVGNALDFFKLSDMDIDLETHSITEIKENTADYNDFFVKAIISDYKAKDDYAYLSVTDNSDVISIFVQKEFISRYIETLNAVGTPVLLHLNGKGTKYSLLSLINLMEPEKYQHEYWLYTGEALNKLQQLRVANQVPCGIASNVKYFISKNGNPCVRYDIRIDEQTLWEGRIRVNPPLMCEGSFVFFLLGDNETFLDILEVH